MIIMMVISIIYW